MQYPLFVCANPISVPTLFMDGPFHSHLQYMIFSETVWSFDDNARNTILDYSISLGNIKDRHCNRGLFMVNSRRLSPSGRGMETFAVSCDHGWADPLPFYLLTDIS